MRSGNSGRVGQVWVGHSGDGAWAGPWLVVKSASSEVDSRNYNGSVYRDRYVRHTVVSLISGIVGYTTESFNDYAPWSETSSYWWREL